MHIATTPQLAAAPPNVLVCECPTRFPTNPLGNAIQAEPLVVENGQVLVPQAPDQGIESGEAAIAELAV